MTKDLDSKAEFKKFTNIPRSWEPMNDPFRERELIPWLQIRKIPYELEVDSLYPDWFGVYILKKDFDRCLKEYKLP